MSDRDTGDIKTVAVIGTGTIGASWAALFLGHGLDVIASDPAAGQKTGFGPSSRAPSRMRAPSLPRLRAT